MKFLFEKKIINPKKLVEMRKEISETINLVENEINLSMGMSADYIQAISQGATVIRVGTKIFGARPVPPVTDDMEKLKI
jgi:uncharacterized pyridoxal phosphate-containing UPF0001 family protein